MHLFSYFKAAKRSMRHKLIGYMIALAVLLVAALCAGLFLFGRLSSPKEEIADSLSLQIAVFQDDMESLWRNVSVMGLHLSEDMTGLLEWSLSNQNITFSDLNGNVDATKAVEDALLEPLGQYVRQSDCSGAFVILESSIRPDDAPDSRSGLFVQKSNAAHVTSDLLLFRGIASIGKAHDVMPHRKWAQEFRIDGFPNYTEHLSGAAAPIADSRRTTDLVALPGTSEIAILLTVPMIGADGTVYGLCGFSINQSYFSSHHEQPSNLRHLACLLTTQSGDTLDVNAGLLTYMEDGFFYVPKEPLTVKPMGEGLVRLTSDEFSFVGMAEPFLTAKGDSNPHTLAVFIPKEDYNRAVGKNIMQTILLAILLLFFTVVCCLFLARRYLAPVQKDMQRLREQDRGSRQMSFLDFEPISATLREQDREHEEMIISLEEEKQTALDQAVHLQEEKEELQGQFVQTQEQLKAAQADAQRLAYSRKTEIDPAIYQFFVEGIDTLTEKERQLFELYAAGIGIQEARAIMNMKPDAVKYHNTNIRAKLGISAIREIARYAALMRQDQTSAKEN